MLLLLIFSLLQPFTYSFYSIRDSGFVRAAVSRETSRILLGVVAYTKVLVSHIE